MIFLTTRILYHDVSENSLVINCFYWFYDKMFSVMHHMLSSNIFMVHVGGFMVNKKNENLDSQRRIALLLILWRLPDFFTSFIAAVASGSVVVWLEFIENASVLIPGVLLAILAGKLNRNLKFKFNYGTGKVEAITALSIEVFDIAGLFCITFFSIKALVRDETREQYLTLALVVSIIGVLIDLFILHRQKIIAERSHSKMIHTAYVSAQKEFFFDAVSIVTLIIIMIFRDKNWIRYFSPVVCLMLVVPFFITVMKHMRASVEELIDRTIDEESQLKIIKVLNEFYDCYEELGDIKSRINGGVKYIDIELMFNKDMDYQTVRETAGQIRTRVQEELGRSSVNLVIM